MKNNCHNTWEYFFYKQNEKENLATFFRHKKQNFLSSFFIFIFMFILNLFLFLFLYYHLYIKTRFNSYVTCWDNRGCQTRTDTVFTSEFKVRYCRRAICSCTSFRFLAFHCFRFVRTVLYCTALNCISYILLYCCDYFICDVRKRQFLQYLF